MSSSKHLTFIQSRRTSCKYRSQNSFTTFFFIDMLCKYMFSATDADRRLCSVRLPVWWTLIGASFNTNFRDKKIPKHFILLHKILRKVIYRYDFVHR